MSDPSKGVSREAGVAGASSGTVLASLFSLMDDGSAKSALLIIAPALAIAVAALWSILVPILNDKLADWKIAREQDRAQNFLENLKSDPTATPEVIKKAEADTQALKLVVLSLSQKRVQAVLDETGEG